MSASENLKRLEEEERQREILVEQTRSRKSDEASKKAAKEESRRQDLYNSGFFAAATLQNELFAQLEQARVVEMISDVTKRKFFKPRAPLTKEELEGSLVVREWPSHEVFAETLDHSGWRVAVLAPEMTRVGKWDEVLKITAVKSHRDYHSGMMRTRQIDRVLFSYSPSQRLFIDGEIRTFEGLLVIPPTQAQTDKLEQAVALAFHKPKIERINPRSSAMLPIMRFTA